MNKNDPLIIPLKSIDFDIFIDSFKKEMNLYFNKIDKAANSNKLINKNQSIVTSLIKKKEYTTKQVKDLQILFDILDKREVFDDIISKRNELYIKKLKKYKIKISEKDTYKISKRNVIKKSWTGATYDLVTKNGKKYLSKTIPLYYKKQNNAFKTLTLLAESFPLYKIKAYHILNKLSFVPKIVEIILVKKNNHIHEIKVISTYIEGLTLQEYLKKKKLTFTQKEQLKRDIHQKFNKIIKLGVNVGSALWRDGIKIDKKNNIYILTGLIPIDTKSQYVFNEVRDYIDTNGKSAYVNDGFQHMAYIIFYNMLKKKLIKFKKIK